MDSFDRIMESRWTSSCFNAELFSFACKLDQRFCIILHEEAVDRLALDRRVLFLAW